MWSITNELDLAEERISGIEDKVEELLHSEHNKYKKISNHDYNIQDILDTIKSPNLLICGVEEGTN
jgi:hypothetical protein